MRHAVRVCRGEEDAHATTFGETDKGRALGADGVHDGTDVVHTHFEGRRPRHPVRHPLSALVEGHDPSETREPPQKSSVSWQLVLKFDV